MKTFDVFDKLIGEGFEEQIFWIGGNKVNDRRGECCGYQGLYFDRFKIKHKISMIFFGQMQKILSI